LIIKNVNDKSMLNNYHTFGSGCVGEAELSRCPVCSFIAKRNNLKKCATCGHVFKKPKSLSVSPPNKIVAAFDILAEVEFVRIGHKTMQDVIGIINQLDIKPSKKSAFIDIINHTDIIKAPQGRQLYADTSFENKKLTDEEFARQLADEEFARQLADEEFARQLADEEFEAQACQPLAKLSFKDKDNEELAAQLAAQLAADEKFARELADEEN